MIRILMKSKLHGATVTQCNLGYVGSLTVDGNLMELADLLPNEKIQVVNLNTGARFETYVIPGEAGSGVIGANGGAARLCVEGDKLIVIAYGLCDDREAARHQPRVIQLGADNQPKA
jgi:aspartate 1-decarboxylase